MTPDISIHVSESLPHPSGAWVWEVRLSGVLAARGRAATDKEALDAAHSEATTLHAPCDPLLR